MTTADGIQVDDFELHTVKNFSNSTIMTYLRAFLSLSGLNRLRIKRLAKNSSVEHVADFGKPPLDCTAERNRTFWSLKEKRTSSSVLSFPDFDVSFIAEKKASSASLGAAVACRAPMENSICCSLPAELSRAPRESTLHAKKGFWPLFLPSKKSGVYSLSCACFTVVTDHRAPRYAF